jgi:hypothetical protein
MKCSRSVVAKRSRRKKRFSSWTAGVSRAISSRKAAFSFRGMDRDLDEAQTSALFGVTPLTTDETILGRIVRLCASHGRLCLSDSWPEGRARFRRGVARQLQRRGLPPGSLTVSGVTA